ncbi:MAG: hypothetical protein WCF67_02255 [Chitinophagaceae bacterium]
MKIRNLAFAALLPFCTACSDQAKSTEETTKKAKDTVVDDSHIATTPIPLDGCYRMVINRDTANLRLNVVDSLVSGHLSYHWAEKDHNDGSVKGIVRNNLVILDYTFRSGGMMSVRQVVFKMAGTALVEGYGDLNTSSDTVRFKNINGLDYQTAHPFIKIPCIE